MQVHSLFITLIARWYGRYDTGKRSGAEPIAYRALRGTRVNHRQLPNFELSKLIDRKHPIPIGLTGDACLRVTHNVHALEPVKTKNLRMQA
ncbi:jg26419 [Pararge aegeria aegeria]|uniref:Jg26419 protein n=1 Tax=Pararge aegeria aegeria TaxID=348720 RepID=A0A8S4RRX9_9NEOP|nr:jg26419 [Pararge aegeria aegeria]